MADISFFSFYCLLKVLINNENIFEQALKASIIFYHSLMKNSALVRVFTLNEHGEKPKEFPLSLLVLSLGSPMPLLEEIEDNDSIS